MKRIALVVAMIFSPLLSSAAPGCVCLYQPDPSAEEIRVARLKAFDGATKVFSGKVLELSQNRVKFKVEKIWKGDSVDEIAMVIHEKDGNGAYVMTSCDYSFKSGERYLVYAYGPPDELSTYVCSRTTLLKHADQEMQGLDEIKLPELRNTESF